jgi:hypothetical protein
VHYVDMLLTASAPVAKRLKASSHQNLSSLVRPPRQLDRSMRRRATGVIFRRVRSTFTHYGDNITIAPKQWHFRRLHPRSPQATSVVPCLPLPTVTSAASCMSQPVATIRSAFSVDLPRNRFRLLHQCKQRVYLRARFRCKLAHCKFCAVCLCDQRRAR